MKVKIYLSDMRQCIQEELLIVDQLLLRKLKAQVPRAFLLVSLQQLQPYAYSCSW